MLARTIQHPSVRTIDHAFLASHKGSTSHTTMVVARLNLVASVPITSYVILFITMTYLV